VISSLCSSKQTAVLFWPPFQNSESVGLDNSLMCIHFFQKKKWRECARSLMCIPRSLIGFGILVSFVRNADILVVHLNYNELSGYYSSGTHFYLHIGCVNAIDQLHVCLTEHSSC
jgi:hypothetical protein